MLRDVSSCAASGAGCWRARYEFRYRGADSDANKDGIEEAREGDGNGEVRSDSIFFEPSVPELLEFGSNGK